MAYLLEICVDSIESAREAIDGGANRLEICSALEVGGLTPSLALVKAVREIISQGARDVEIYCMIRPRPGDFCYSPEEVAQMKAEVDMIKDLHLTDGFVFGLLLNDGSVDVNNCKLLLGVAHPLPVTFHRAFDACVDPLESLEIIIELGFRRILTSGQKRDVQSGIHLISDLIRRSDDRIIIMPGSGINETNLEWILKKTTAQEFHSSGSFEQKSAMKFVNSFIEPQFYRWRRTDASRVEAMQEVIKKLRKF